MSKIYIGIDPGLTGAVSVINGEGEVRIFDTPIIEIKKKKSIKNEYLPVEMSNLIKGIIGEYKFQDCHIAIEKVHSMPKQGVVSSFSFGKGNGIWLGIIAALNISSTEIPPQEWKKEIMNGMSDKDKGRIRAQQLFPQCAHSLNLKKHIGRADSLLIAEYARRKNL